MADEKNIHWTTDEALLERYVMGRLGAEESAVLEGHLEVCTGCQEIVRSERQIVAGIRAVGRDELKSRLAQRIGKRPSVHMTVWYRVAGIAAALVLLLTIGIYNDWFSGSRVQPVLSPSRADSSVQGTGQRLPADIEGNKGAGPLQYAEGKKEKRAEPQGVTNESVKSAELEQRKALQIERGNPQNVDVAHATRAENAPAKDEKLATSAAEAPREIWVGGTVISAEVEGRTFGKLLMKSDGKKYDNSKREKSAPKPMVQEERGAGNQIGLRAVDVTQRKISELPQMRKDARAGTVQMLFRKHEKGLQVTLFMDSLLSKSEIGSARLETVRPDSNILHLGKKWIAFRLPVGWLQESLGNKK